jgi:hypothetical protein
MSLECLFGSGGTRCAAGRLPIGSAESRVVPFIKALSFHYLSAHCGSRPPQYSRGACNQEYASALEQGLDDETPINRRRRLAIETAAPFYKFPRMPRSAHFTARGACDVTYKYGSSA